MPKGLDFDELFANDRFLKAGEFQGRDVTLTISNVRRETFETEDENGKKGKTEKKAILSFAPTAAGKAAPKEIVLNKTNGLCLKAMFGRDTGAWIGKRVTFYPTLVKAFGAQELAIRVRGSPDIQTFTFKLKLPRKKDTPTTMTRTETKPRQSGAQQQPAPQRQDEPPADLVLPGQTGYVSPAEPPPPGDEDAPGGVQ